MCVSVGVLKSAGTSGCYHALSFWTMSCFLFTSSPLDFSVCSAVPLRCSQIWCEFRCFCLFLTTVSLPVSFDVLSRTAEHSGIPLKSFFDCNYSYWQSFFFFFFRLSVCWISKMDIRSLTMTVDIFFSGRRWVSRFITEPFTMKDRGIKAATASTQTPAP